MHWTGSSKRTLLVAAVTVAAILSPAPTRAQLDPSGAWSTWHTEHFRVHAKTRLSPHGLKAATEAERAYSQLATELRPPRGTIDLVITDNVDFSNGYATVFPTSRIVIYLTSPSTGSSLAMYDDWLRMVILHELVHIFHNDRADGLWNVLQTVFGRAPGSFPNTYQPAWVTEGIAVYYESRFTSAGRVRGSYHGQLLSATSRDGTWPSPGDATYTNRVWPSGTIPYAWGGRFFDRQRAEFGDSTTAAFIDRTSRQLIVFNVNSPMKAAGTAGVDSTWDALRESSLVPQAETTLLDRGLRAEPRPRLSPDGRLLAYRRLSGRDPERLVVRDLGTGEVQARKRLNSLLGLEWSGQDLYVAQLDYDSPVRIHSDLYRWSALDEWERLTAGARNTDVFLFPDGRLGVVGLSDGTRQIFAADSSGSIEHRVEVPRPEADDWGRIAVSPTGDRIAAARHADGRWDIVIWPVGRPDRMERVTNDAALDQDASWSADGQWLLFSSERKGLPQVFAHDAASDVTYQLTEHPTGAREPTLGPDGTLYFSTVLGDGHAIVERRNVQFIPAGASPDTVANLVTAEAVPARETGYSPWGTLLPRYWIPIGHDESDAGFFLGGLTSASDVLGRTSYALAASVAPSTGRWEAAMSAEHQRWRSWSVDLTAGQTWDYLGLGLTESGGRVPVSSRERAAEVGVRYRWRRWRSAFSPRLGLFVERDELTNDGSEPLAWVPDSTTFGGAVLSAGLSHVERAPLSISPQNGFALAGLYARRWELGGSGWSNELSGRATGYLALPLPGFAQWVLAARVSGGISGGTHPVTFSIGGESSDVVSLLPGTSLGSGRKTFQLRGYSKGGRFTRATVAMAELRIPILVAGKGIGRLPLLLDRLSANVFYEVGGGWVADEEPAPTSLSDVGAEAVVDMGLGPAMVLRTRVGWAVALQTGLGSSRGDSRFYVAFGPSF